PITRDELKEFIKAFETGDRFSHLPEIFLEGARILVSRPKLASLMTTERIKNIAKDLRVTITVTS
ncbi:MAG: hypothetical protein LBJ12_01900, partial [Oscillospiraceae bacterium]|nr:hypothetical protein [Oscillospiraceae bacterium]